MDSQFFRKYVDIIEAAEKAPQQLDEGMMDTIKSLVPKAMKLLGGDTIAQIAQQVKQATGGDYTPSKENAIAVAKALGFEELLKAKAGKGGEQVAEGWAGNWQGKLLQLAHLGGLAGAGYAAMNPMMGDATGIIYEGLLVIGVILLMVANTFWSSDRGMIGAMGKHGNKGFGTGKGPVSL
jgi:hypothetical protein